MSKLTEKFQRRPRQITVEEYLEKLIAKGINPAGQEVPDPVPMAPPIGYKKQPSMVEIVRDMVRGEKLRLEALEAGSETFEESEDFDVGDENAIELRSGYENDFDPPLVEIAKEVEIARKSAANAPPDKTASPPTQPTVPASDGHPLAPDPQ